MLLGMSYKIIKTQTRVGRLQTIKHKLEKPCKLNFIATNFPVTEKKTHSRNCMLLLVQKSESC